MELRNYILPDVLALALFIVVARSHAVAPVLPDLRRAGRRPRARASTAVSCIPYGWVIVVAWLGLAAGVLDILENAGIWLDLRRGLSALAPVTATFALLKWIAVALAV